jgi:alkylation response protein AidB-like acyl-CoA dehydrogenase
MATELALDTLLERVEEITPVIRKHASEAELDRQLSGTVIEAMYDAGLFGMMLPKARGGLELHPVATMRVLEAVARVDSAAAWNLVMLQAIAAYAAWMTPKGADELFREGIPTVAGALNPPAVARRVDGGWLITGQCPFASGCHHAQWLAMPALEAGSNAPFGVFFPRSQAKLLDTWHTLGMRGTGSADYAVRDLFVPEHMTAPVTPLSNPAPGFEGPLYRLWPLAFGVLNEAVVSVGIAAAAVDEAVRLCKSKTPAYNSTPLREQQLAQFLLGKAQSRVEASRDTLHNAVAEGYEDVARTGALLSESSKVRMQLAASFAAEACAEAVRLVSDAVGTSSIRQEQPYERHLRDAHTLVQHSSKSAPRYGSAGRLMLGLENDWVWLTF